MHCYFYAVYLCNQGGTAKRLIVPRYTVKVYLGIIYFHEDPRLT